ncbi:ATP-binding protein [Undibacterium sp. TJN25]|uniref:ATP-binding protein n=1 Tax=Undibacterium sp. TJN25 TaxID=3413056 RepID=UPI003BF00DE0
MEMFITNEDVIQLEGTLAASPEVERLPVLVTLAWHLRQRDTRKALALAAEGDALLARSRLPEHLRHSMSARLSLVHGEARWLFAELEDAQNLAEQAVHEFEVLGDVVGSADAHFLLGSILLSRGNPPRVVSEMEAAAACARQAGDIVREELAEGGLAFNAAVKDVHDAAARWGNRFYADRPGLNLALQVSVHEFLSQIAGLSGDFAKALTHGMQAYEAALATGQIRRAIHTAANVGDAFNSLNDHQEALVWMQRSHDLARPTGWPASIGLSLTQMAETLRRLGRLAPAQELLEEALLLLTPLKGSRNYLMALRYQGDLALDCGDFELALNSFQQLKHRADASSQMDFQIGSRRGLAHALSEMDHAEEALKTAQEALTLAQRSKDNFRQIDVLKVLAAIHARHQLPAPAQMSEASAPLHYLQQALDVAAVIKGYTIPGTLLDAIADAHAALGDFKEAFVVGRLAIAARDKTHNQEASNRATAMQVSHQTERMRAEGEYHRQLAIAEAERAEVLQQTSASLERLGAIGQEITANLDLAAVFQALNRHVHGLLHVTSFVIYLMDTDRQTITSAFSVENGVRLPPNSVSLSNDESNSVRCLRQQKEIMIDIDPGQTNPNLVPGTEATLSLLFAPLTIADRVLGVMTIQSSEQFAYGERERLIFRTLCAYGAIAVDNANAYRLLKETQAQLVAQEKLAALGSLVAGVAHELNTPIGNCLLVASTLAENTRQLTSKLQGEGLKRSDLNAYCANAQTSSTILMRGLTSAATLVSSFKQVAVDRTSEQRRVFDLRQVMQEIVATLNLRIGHSGQSISLDIPPHIAMDSYPGSLGQVITNLIDNALLHAFDGSKPGHMQVTAALADNERVRIEFRDNGVGIPQENLKRIFDPFFTTKLGQGGSGLGLNICYNIVTSIMAGDITVHSELGAGSTFVVELPLNVPEKRE